MMYNSLEAMPLVINVPDLADTLQIGVTKAYELVNNGEIKTLRIGKQIRISRMAFAEFLMRESKAGEH